MKLNRTREWANAYLSIAALIFIIAWASSLPTRFISFSTTTPLVMKAINGLIFTASHSSGVVLGWLIARKSKNLRSILLITSLLCLFGTVVLYYVKSDQQAAMIFVLFFFYGVYIASVSQLVQTQVSSNKRVYIIGFLIFSRALLAFVTYPKFQDLNPLKPFSSSLIMILIVITVSFLIKQDSFAGDSSALPKRDSRKAALSLVYLLIYFLLLSITKGLMIQQLSYHTLFATTNLSISIFVSYSVAVFSIILAAGKPNLRVVLFIANSLLIIAVISFSYSHDSVVILQAVNVLLYFSFAVNEIFCFHSFFEIGDILKNGALTFGLTFTISSLGMLIGKMFAEYNHIAQIISVERIIIFLFCTLTIILPSFLIQLTKLSTTSIFRINAVIIEDLVAEDSTIQTKTNEPIPNFEFTKVYTQVENYNTLTNREKEVLDLLIKGYPSEVICTTLFISANTLKRHVQNIYNKLNVHNRAELFKLLHKT